MTGSGQFSLLRLYCQTNESIILNRDTRGVCRTLSNIYGEVFFAKIIKAVITISASTVAYLLHTLAKNQNRNSDQTVLEKK